MRMLQTLKLRSLRVNQLIILLCTSSLVLGSFCTPRSVFAQELFEPKGLKVSNTNADDPKAPSPQKPKVKKEQFTRIIAREDVSLLIATLSLGEIQLLDALLLYEDFDTEQFYLPLIDLVESLQFPIAVNKNGLSAKGWFITEENTFELDLNTGKVQIKGQTYTLEEGSVERHNDGIYVSLETLADWFPLTAEFDYNDLSVVVKSLVPLPIEVRMIRDNRRDKLQKKAKPEDRENPLEEIESPLLTVPFVDISAQSRYNDAPDAAQSVEKSYTTLISGIVLGQDMHMSINDTVGDRSKPDKRIKMSRQDLDNDLLGLGLSAYEFGDISTRTIPVISRGSSGRGLTFSNQPISNNGNINFNLVELRGELPVGYEIDVVKDGQLVGFIEEPDENGEYVFETQASPGLNVFELTFYGPQGQKETQEERIFVPVNLVEKGQFDFNISILQQNRKVFETRPKGDDNTGKKRIHGDFEYGLGDASALYAAFSSVPLDGKRKNYGILQFTHSYKGVRADFSYARSDVKGGEAYGVSLQGTHKGVRWQAQHKLFYGFDSEVTRNAGISGDLRHDTFLSASGLLPYLKNTPLSIKLGRVQNTDGLFNTDWQTRLTKNFGKIRLTTQLDQSFKKNEDSRINLNTQLSSRYQNLTLRGTTNYEIQPVSHLKSANISADWKYKKKTTLSGGLRYAGGDDPLETLSLGISHDFDIMEIGLNSSYNSKDEFLAILSTSFSIGYDPMSPPIRMTREHRNDAAYFIPRVFYDENQNNAFDEEETLLENVTFSGKGIDNKAKTNASGHTFVHASSYERSSIEVNPSSLNNPFYRSFDKPKDYILRPGQTYRKDFPIIMTGEADTQVYAFHQGKRVNAQSISLQVISNNGDVVSTAKSEYDGFVFLKGIPLGNYKVRPDPDQVNDLGYCPARPHALTLDADEPFSSIESFSLWPLPEKNTRNVILEQKIGKDKGLQYWDEVRADVANLFTEFRDIPLAYLIESNSKKGPHTKEANVYDLVLYGMDKQDAEIVCMAMTDSGMACTVDENSYTCPDNVIEITQMKIQEPTTALEPDNIEDLNIDYDSLKDINVEQIEDLIDN